MYDLGVIFNNYEEGKTRLLLKNINKKSVILFDTIYKIDLSYEENTIVFDTEQNEYVDLDIRDIKVQRYDDDLDLLELTVWC